MSESPCEKCDHLRKHCLGPGEAKPDDRYEACGPYARYLGQQEGRKKLGTESLEHLGRIMVDSKMPTAAKARIMRLFRDWLKSKGALDTSRGIERKGE